MFNHEAPLSGASSFLPPSGSRPGLTFAYPCDVVLLPLREKVPEERKRGVHGGAAVHRVSCSQAFSAL